MSSKKSGTPSEMHPLFPSGEWEGFYTYAYGPSAHQHPMAIFLNFKNNMVTGGGSDDIGAFSWRGTYDTKQLVCKLTKHYATHPVHYDGQVDESGIWGTWTISDSFKGGFHIWPKNNAEEEAAEEKESVPEVIEQETLALL